jgi:hypothetical protein
MKSIGFPLRSAVARALSPWVVAAATMVSGPASAAIFTEVGDAGQTLATAQIAGAFGGASPLSTIFGSLSSSTDADLYLINITHPLTFSATTIGGALDTQLFLFNLGGAPVFMNDDADGLTLQSTLPAGHALGPVSAGVYVLGVSLAGYDPVNEVNQLLFDVGLTTDVRGAAPGLSPASLFGFANNTFFADSGDYAIQLTGTATVPVPEPVSSLLVAMALAACGVVTVKGRRRTTTQAVAA